MLATPRRVFVNLDLPLGRVEFQVFAIVREADLRVPRQLIEDKRQGHVAVCVMMAIGFAVGGNVDELRVVAIRVEAVAQTTEKAFAAVEEFLEGDGARDGAVIEEDRDGIAGWQRAAI